MEGRVRWEASETVRCCDGPRFIGADSGGAASEARTRPEEPDPECGPLCPHSASIRCTLYPQLQHI